MFRIREVFGVELSLAAFYEAPTLAASAAAIDAAQQAGLVAVRAPRSPAAPSSIGRRDRTAYRVAASQPTPDRPPDRPPGRAPHWVRLDQALPERTVAEQKQEG